MAGARCSVVLGVLPGHSAKVSTITVPNVTFSATVGQHAMSFSSRRVISQPPLATGGHWAMRPPEFIPEMRMRTEGVASPWITPRSRNTAQGEGREPEPES
jgi:hypothetical protein